MIGYGYNHDTQVSGIVDGYIKAGIPLDGMHLDVDFQVLLRTEQDFEYF